MKYTNSGVMWVRREDQERESVEWDEVMRRKEKEEEKKWSGDKKREGVSWGDEKKGEVEKEEWGEVRWW